MYKRKSAIIQPVSPSVHILVKREKATFLTQLFHDCTAVTTTPESDINIDAFGVDIQPINGLLEESGNMILSRGHFTRFL